MDPSPLPSPSTWLPTDGSAESTAIRAVVFGLFMLAAALTAVAAWSQGPRIRAWAGRSARWVAGRPPTAAPWASGEWACGACRSFNPRSADRCRRCRSPRATAEVALPAPVPAPDIVPATVPAAGSVVTLEHDARAHTDGLSRHWRLRVDGVIVGSAARRDGALALLRAVDGADVVRYDLRGTGVAEYPLPALIAAFEGPKLPVAGPCPEAVRPPR